MNPFHFLMQPVAGVSVLGQVPRSIVAKPLQGEQFWRNN